jgi:hypothetical protein
MQNIVKLKVRVGEHIKQFDGRAAWALQQLIVAGTEGCTPLQNPAPRWSHYVWLIRGEGVEVETIHEKHGGAYRGHHARYVLRTPVEVLEAKEAA